MFDHCQLVVDLSGAEASKPALGGIFGAQADIGHDPKPWLAEAATAADQSDDHGALTF